MSFKDMKITPEMSAPLQDAIIREIEFWARHGIEHEADTRTSVNSSEAYGAWVAAVELEYKSKEGPGRVHLDTPIARKAFILGYNRGKSR